MSQFIYLLNAFEAASQHDTPAEVGYPAKRKALLEYVEKLESARPEALAFQEAVWLLEVCRSCDLVYDGPWGPTGPDVHVIVDAFLKKHKSVIEGYAPQCPESPRGTK